MKDQKRNLFRYGMLPLHSRQKKYFLSCIRNVVAGLINSFLPTVITLVITLRPGTEMVAPGPIPTQVCFSSSHESRKLGSFAL